MSISEDTYALAILARGTHLFHDLHAEPNAFGMVVSAHLVRDYVRSVPDGADVWGRAADRAGGFLLSVVASGEWDGTPADMVGRALDIVDTWASEQHVTAGARQYAAAVHAAAVVESVRAILSETIEDGPALADIMRTGAM